MSNDLRLQHSSEGKWVVTDHFISASSKEFNWIYFFIVGESYFKIKKQPKNQPNREVLYTYPKVRFLF